MADIHLPKSQRTIRLVFRLRDFAVRVTGHLWLGFVHVGARRRRTSEVASMLAIDSGEASWRFIDYQELLLSAVEFLGEGKVVQVVIKDRDHYFREVRSQTKDIELSHYFFDPRSLSYGCVRSWVQVVVLSTYLAWRGITPIARLTDVHHRRWRAQTTFISSLSGVIIILMSPQRARELMVNGRLVGPLPMPVSKQTFDKLTLELREEVVNPGSVLFIGALYEPRLTFLERVAELLLEDGIVMRQIVREAGGPRISNMEYWRSLAAAEVVFSTSEMSYGPGQDTVDEAHLIYRFMEAAVVGRPLVTRAVFGAENLFVPGVHFEAYTDPRSAANHIVALHNNHLQRELIGKSARERADQLIEKNFFWTEVNNALLAERRPLLGSDRS